MHSTEHPTILGLDPGTRFLGAAVLRGRNLLAYGVHELKNGDHAYDVIGQARRIVFSYIEQHCPQVVAIEAPYLIATKRGAILTTLAHELHGRAQDLGLTVREFSPESVRLMVAGNTRATKIDVATTLIGKGFSELGHLVPKKPVRSGLGLRPRDRYWLHMFDALAIAQAAWVVKPPLEAIPSRRDIQYHRSHIVHSQLQWTRRASHAAASARRAAGFERLAGFPRYLQVMSLRPSRVS